MRTKVEILNKADEATVDIRKRSILEAYYMRLGLEVIIDIRDILNDRLNFIYRLFHEIRDHK